MLNSKKSQKPDPKPQTKHGAVDSAEELDEQVRQKKKERRRVWRRNILIIILIIIIILLLLRRCGSDIPAPAPIQKWFNTLVDPNAGDPIQTNKQEEIDRLNQQLAESSLTVSINKSPIFPNGAAEGTLNIINMEENKYPQVVELYMMDETGEVTKQRIYQSGLIPVGKTVKTAKLDVNLAAGKYRVMAFVNAVNGETGMVVGTVQTPLNLTVSN